MPPFINRRLSITEWLSYVAAYDFGRIAPTRVVLHHTYIPTIEQWRGLATMQGMQRFYGAKGWRSGPHIYVAPDGIWLATPMKDIGIHAGTGNSGTAGGKLWYSIGCEMVGYYDKVRPSGAVWEGTKAVLGGLSKRLGIAPRQLISFHRDYTNQKSCPGWAVTKDWVWPEIEAWLGNQAAPPQPPPPVQVGTPTPENEALLDLLMNESFQRRGDGYNPDLAFNQYAVQHSLGFPTAKAATLADGGKTYAYQAFARDTLYCEVPRWGEVGRLSDLLGGSIPPSGLGRALLDATYRASGAIFHPDWAFHQYAVAAKLGPPLAESTKLKVGGVEYAYQVYALDTLYNKIPDWQAIHRVSELASASDAASAQLRDALLSATYQKAAGVAYHPDWAFHQIARKLNLGAPLSDSYRVTSGASQYAIQVYATDTLYNIIPKWQEVRRALPLASGGSGVVALSAGGAVPAAKPRAGMQASTLPEDSEIAVVLGRGAVFEQPGAPFHIVRYRVPFAAASGTRSGARARLLVLHSSTGSAEEDLRAMAAPDAQSMAHYYITAEGQIYQLADDDRATFHAGMATWQGRRQNINRISLGITVQRSTKGYTEAAKKALAWLVATLRERYNLAHVVRWGDLDADSRPDGADLSW
ncbi:N-acetylmuramoyl-L-alanine amidase [Chloroflexia bacterium SDU3-3]|nr:N-acetylmuramoyl-L-alanine amidase [Chloroflexia bacterium SDU3-3]